MKNGVIKKGLLIKRLIKLKSINCYGMPTHWKITNASKRSGVFYILAFLYAFDKLKRHFDQAYFTENALGSNLHLRRNQNDNFAEILYP